MADRRLAIPFSWFLTVFLVVVGVWVVDFDLLFPQRISPEIFTVFEFTGGIDGAIVVSVLSFLRLRSGSKCGRAAE